MINHSLEFSPSLEGWWCVIREHKLYLPAPTSRVPFGTFADLPLSHPAPKIVHEIGEHDGAPVFAIHLESKQLTDAELEDFSGLRAILFSHPEMFEFASRAFQVCLFLRTHKYCGQCGEEMSLIDWELATHCTSCNHRCYPRISPVVIVAIRKGKQILLAQGKRSTSGFYSVLAGFVESGETLEQAVHREVFEEVGIKIKNIKYFGSQPWPFPHSLMAGFLAEYDSGEITLCEDEILAADWFSLEDMPQTPPGQTISGQLIETTKKMMQLAK